MANAYSIQNAAGTKIFDFTPDGNDGILDPFSLNTTLSSNSGSLATPISRSGNFLSDTITLAAGIYTIGLSTQSTENITSNVPEPSSLLLIGTGLGLLGSLSLRRRKPQV